MGAHHHLSTLCCELRIIRAKNIELKSTGHLFVRCYLYSGNQTRVTLNSQEISSKSNLFWNQTFKLDCFGTKDSIHMLNKENTVVFELQYRSKVPLVGCLVGSQILGTAEIPWKAVFESPEMEIEKWVPMVLRNGRVHGDLKPPAVQIAMKVHVPAMVEERGRRRESSLRKGDDDCGCMEGGACCNFADYDLFAVGVVLEAY